VSAPRVAGVEAALAAELPELGLLEHRAAVADPQLRSPAALQARLNHLADRFRGARAVRLREEPITAAYRRAFRQVGLDPDAEPTPLERAARLRIVAGGFPSADLLADSLLVALLDTSVPVWALDAAPLRGPLTLRQGAAGAALGAGRLVIADDGGPRAELFREPPAEYAPHEGSGAVRLYAVTVSGVPQLYAAEALETAADLLAAA
jgi:DNA/RNA-binding domain of Phe-tRNA-synthetase-like protein